MKENKKLIVFIAMSMDGYIAKMDDDLSFLNIVEQPSEDYGYSEFIKTIDTVIIGRKTYDKVLSMGVEFPHSDKNTYVITRTPRPAANKIIFYSGQLKSLVQKLKNESGKNIFCDGGAEIVNELFKNNLIDEIIISILPILLGEGIQLFNAGRPEFNLTLLHSKLFEKGLVQLHYKINNSNF